MPPRLQFRRNLIHPETCPQISHLTANRYATAAAIAPAAPIEHTIHSGVVSPIARYPSTRPPSHKPPEFRKSQLHRQYASQLRSTPLVLLFQHNNLKAQEWSGIRRVLSRALREVDASNLATASGGNGIEHVGDHVKISTVQTGIFAAALRVVEFWHPERFEAQLGARESGPTDPSTSTSTPFSNTTPNATDIAFTHGLSHRAWRVATNKRNKHPLETLLSGPLAILTMPTVSPQHLAAALRILAPNSSFPAPRRKANPAYHEPVVQAGLQKLLLLGARVEGKIFDDDGARWVGGIEGGLLGLRGQLVAMLQGFGAGLTTTLEGASRSLYITMESRRMDMDEIENPKAQEAKKEEGSS